MTRITFENKQTVSKDAKKKRGFTLAEVMILFLIASVAIAATLPVMTIKKKVTSGSGGTVSSDYWQFGTGANIYYSNGKVGVGTSTPNASFQAQNLIELDNNKTCLGYWSGWSCTSNAAIGYNVRASGRNVGIGAYALNTISNDETNTAIGSMSLRNNTTGTNNTAVGYNALNANVSGSNNTAVGVSSQGSNLESYNTSVGYWSMLQNTTGHDNIAIGVSALKYNKTGSNNIVIGYRSLESDSNYNSNNNIAVGYTALFYNNTGIYNIALGAGSLGTNTSGSYNISSDHFNMNQNRTGSNNISFGYWSLYTNTSGSNNIAIGYMSLYDRNNIGNNIAIGFQSNLAADNLEYATAIGAESSANCSNCMVLGKSDTTVGIGTPSPINTYKLDINGSAYSTGTWESSDRRFKRNIIPLVNPLDKLIGLQGVNFFWKSKEYPEKNFDSRKQIGLIAQDVEKVYPELVTTDNKGYKSIEYSRLTAISIEAVKEIEINSTETDKKLENLEKRLNQLEKNHITLWDKVRDFFKKFLAMIFSPTESQKR